MELDSILQPTPLSRAQTTAQRRGITLPAAPSHPSPRHLTVTTPLLPRRARSMSLRTAMEVITPPPSMYTALGYGNAIGHAAGRSPRKCSSLYSRASRESGSLRSRRTVNGSPSPKRARKRTGFGIGAILGGLKGLGGMGMKRLGGGTKKKMVSIGEKAVVGTSSRIAFYDVDTDMEAAVRSGTSTALIPDGAPMSAISPRPAHLHLHLPQHARALSLDASAEMSIDSPTSSQYLLVPPSFRFPSDPSPASGSSYYADGRRSDPFVTPPLGSASMSIDSPLLSPITNRVSLTVEEKAVRSRMKKVQLLGPEASTAIAMQYGGREGY
ncbi:hypothetical protein B0H34DRAFT_861822 [Crassisporium funariophilum]|nr:hypothetical protein B0H34DRAFT_861822 [Crassisporium funariophilum]